MLLHRCRGEMRKDAEKGMIFGLFIFQFLTGMADEKKVIKHGLYDPLVLLGIEYC